MKLLVSDYDGTINIHGRVSKDDLESLYHFYDQGNIISIASSRPYESLHPEMIRQNIPYHLLMCNNGNAIFDKNGLIDLNCLSLEELIIFRNLLKELPNNSVISSCDAYGIITPNNPLYYRLLLEGKSSFERYYQMFLDNGFEADFYKNKGIVFSGKRQKDYATYYAIQKYGIKREEVYTIGDGDNDYLMLREFDGYTFPWGSPKVKELKLKTVNSVSEVIN